MIVPTSQSVAAQPLANGYADASVSALSQGGGVAQGISEIGGALAGEAIKAKKQADQAAEFEATADINDFADGLYQDLRSKDGPAALQAYEQMPAAYDEAVSERLSRITSPEAKTAAEQNARLIRGNTLGKAKATAEPIIFKTAVDANQRLLKSYGKSITLAVSNGGVRYSQTPSLPASVIGMPGTTGSDAPAILDERAIAPYRAQAHEANVKFAEANSDHLDTDQASYVKIADDLWNQDANEAVIRGLLARGDDATARQFFQSHKAELPDEMIDDLDKATENAVVIGNSQRAAANAWTTAAGDTVSARQKAAVAALPKGLTDDERSLAVKQIGTAADAKRADDTQAATDAYNAGLTALQQGASITDMMKEVWFQTLQRDYPEKAGGLISNAINISTGGLAVTDDAVYGEWWDKINDADPADVAQLDPTEAVGRGLSDKSAKALAKKIEKKAKLAVGSLSPDAVISQAVTALYNEATFNAANNFTTTTEKTKGAAKRQAQIGAFQRAADDAITWLQGQQDKPVSTDQVRTIVDDLSAAVMLDEDTWGTAVDLSIEAGGLIPPEDVVGIVDRLLRTGIPVTREEILNQWRTAETVRASRPAGSPDVGY